MCGCNLMGQQFGRLLVIERAEHSKGNRPRWKCQCQCGNTSIVHSAHLKNGHTKSCGCLQRERTLNKNRYKKRYIGSKNGKGIGRREHSIIAEKALGRPLRENEVVHHINGDKHDNRNRNLLICSKSYHTWLHSRMRKAESCIGNNRKYDYNKILLLYNSGLTLRGVSQEIGCVFSTVKRAIEILGGKTRTKSDTHVLRQRKERTNV